MDSDNARTGELATTLAALIAGAVLIGTGYAIWGKIAVALHWPALWSSLTCYLLGFAMCAVAFVPLGARTRENAAVASLAFAFAIAAVNWMAYVVNYYGTDSLLFNAFAAHLLAHGLDPYTQSMQPAYQLYGAPVSLVTPTTNGEAVYGLSYPALSFLMYLPFEPFHVSALWLNVGAHLAVLATLAIVAPRPFKAFAMLPLFADGAYFAYTLGAVTDILWVLPFLFVMLYWRSNPALAALFLGVACSIKQTPWLIVPFALVLWANDWRRSRDLQAFAIPAGILIGTFAVFNLPFALWHPAAWLAGVLKPLAGNLVPFGSGLVQLSTSTMYDFPIARFAVAAGTVFVLSLAAYAVRPLRLHWLPFVATPLVLFCAARSLHNYFMYWPVVLVAYALGPQSVAVPAVSPRLRRGVAACILIALPAILAVAIAVAILRPHPSDLTVARYRFDPATHRLATVDLQFANPSPRERRLRFAISRSEVAGSLEMLSGGLPERIPPNATVPLSLDASQTTIGDTPDPLTVQVVAIDVGDGTQTWSRAMTIIPPSTFLIDPELTRWTPGDIAAPAGWDIDRSDFASGRIRRSGPSALRFDVPSPRGSAWSVASIGQTIPAEAASFVLRIRPYQNYDGGEYPLAFFGLELIDALDRHVNFVFSSRVVTKQVYRRPRFVVYVFPCKLGTWNDVRIDLAQIAHDTDFLMGPEAKMRFNVLAAVHQDSLPAVRGDFGGIHGVVRAKGP